MSLRGRLTLAAAGAVALAVLIASVGVYFVVRSQLRGEVDSSLRQRAALISSLPANFELQRRPTPPSSSNRSGSTWRPPRCTCSPPEVR